MEISHGARCAVHITKPMRIAHVLAQASSLVLSARQYVLCRGTYISAVAPGAQQSSVSGPGYCSTV